jgi:hypothetical protein
MSDAQHTISAAVGNGGRNTYMDVITIQFLLNSARARTGQGPIGLDGKIGNETIGAISDFQRKSFGAADGRIDVGGRSFRRLVAIYEEPALVNPKTYIAGKDGRYKVVIGQDGRLFVQPGDWLSKYSAAVNGNFFHIYDFGRMVNGTPLPIGKIDLIRAGEVLWHFPTYFAYMGAKNKVPPPPPVPIPDAEKKRITEESVKGEFKLKGDYGIKILDKIGDKLQWVGPIVDVVSYVVPFLEKAGTTLGFVGLIMDQYGYHKAFAEAHDVDLRIYGLRGVAYATTAWAFGDPIPSRSPTIRQNQIAQYGGSTARIQKLDQVWREGADSAIKTQERNAMENSGTKATRDEKLNVWKAAIMATGDGNRANVCKLQMQALGERFLKDASFSVKRVWDHNLTSVLYPS